MAGKDFEELEQELNKQEQMVLDPKQINGPEDLFAQYFHMYKPMFNNYLNALSQKQLRRLIRALIEYPLNETEFHHSKEEEKNALLIGEKLLHAKQMMIMHTLSEHYKKQEEEEQKAKDNLKQEIKDGEKT